MASSNHVCATAKAAYWLCGQQCSGQYGATGLLPQQRNSVPLPTLQAAPACVTRLLMQAGISIGRGKSG